jgi:hypothetical protein
LKPLELTSGEKQIPQVIENIENGWNSKEALERAVMRPRQVRYQAALRPDICCSFDFKPLPRVKILPGMPKLPDRCKTVTKPHQLGLSVSKPGQPSFAFRFSKRLFGRGLHPRSQTNFHCVFSALLVDALAGIGAKMANTRGSSLSPQGAQRWLTRPERLARALSR